MTQPATLVLTIGAEIYSVRGCPETGGFYLTKLSGHGPTYYCGRVARPDQSTLGDGRFCDCKSFVFKHAGIDWSVGCKHVAALSDVGLLVGHTIPVEHPLTDGPRPR